MCLQSIFLVRAKRSTLLEVHYNYLPFSMQQHFINISSDASDDKHPFENLWIGKGRKYPKNPLDVRLG